MSLRGSAREAKGRSHGHAGGARGEKKSYSGKCSGRWWCGCVVGAGLLGCGWLQFWGPHIPPFPPSPGPRLSTRMFRTGTNNVSPETQTRPIHLRTTPPLIPPETPPPASIIPLHPFPLIGVWFGKISDCLCRPALLDRRFTPPGATPRYVL
ncbi:uncharacterized protein QC764_0110790 [Podospora pseudoanserina]|uniref:Uncharacterized protein n=2 Tax=Podospora TaxID=5144 RepID=A0ABR0HIX2_9PEZI|nr:hypothetical protein QC764_0110790 [Podospora pseudoanserina]